MSIAENVDAVRVRISQACERVGRSPDEVTLVAITKTQEPAAIREAHAAGLRHFGENRVQEAKGKLDELQDLRTSSTWHMVGHLQTNKAGLALELFDTIQSIDSVRLAESVGRHADRIVPVMIEVNVAGEDTKAGLELDEVKTALDRIRSMPKLEVTGLMTVAPWMADPEEVRPVFRRLKQLRDELGVQHLSMGMTDDFEVAIEEGATVVRVGRAIFGERRA